jgi:hypothetical protein
VTRRGYHCRGQPGSAQGKPALLDRQNPNWLPSKFVVAGSGGSLEISRSVQSGEKPKIAEVNLLGLTGDLDGTLTLRVVKTIETCSPKTSRLEGQSTQEEEAVDSNTAPTMHWARLQQKASCSSPSDQQAAAPLTKGDLLIVAFVSSLWLWAATWAMASAALR